MNEQKKPSDVRGNQIKCINYQMCPMCYGCRAYDSRDPECYDCKLIDINKGRNFNICNKDLHESWKINKIISKTQINIEDVKFEGGQ